MRRRRGSELGERRVRVQARAICVDGPAAKVGLEREVAKGEVVVVPVLVDGEWRRAEYVGAGRVAEVPPADGVGLRFRRLLEEPLA